MKLLHPQTRPGPAPSQARTWRTHFLLPLVALGSFALGVGLGLFLSPHGSGKETDAELDPGHGAMGRLVTAKPIFPEDLERLRALIQGDDGHAAWAAIPWLTSMPEARKRAATEGKPILLWLMDGHPLGCT